MGNTIGKVWNLLIQFVYATKYNQNIVYIHMYSTYVELILVLTVGFVQGLSDRMADYFFAGCVLKNI